MANYQNIQELLGALKSLEDLWSQGDFDRFNALIVKVEAQLPGFQVQRSSVLEKCGLFPQTTEQEREESEMAEQAQIAREWDKYRRGMESRG